MEWVRRDVRSPSKLNEERLDGIVSVLRIEELLHNLLVPSGKQLSGYLYLSVLFRLVNLEAKVALQVVRHIDGDVLVRCRLRLFLFSFFFYGKNKLNPFDYNRHGA